MAHFNPVVYAFIHQILGKEYYVPNTGKGSRHAIENKRRHSIPYGSSQFSGRERYSIITQVNL